MYRTVPRMAGYVPPYSPYDPGPAHNCGSWWMGFQPLARWHDGGDGVDGQVLYSEKQHG